MVEIPFGISLDCGTDKSVPYDVGEGLCALPIMIQVCEKGNEMDNRDLIKNKMNEILRGDTDMLARKYIGRSADTMNSKDKDKALADIYMAFNDALKKSKEVKSDVALRREQIDNEMKNIRNRDRDELLSQRIKNYDPSISIKEKDAILGKIYDGLQNERNKLDKSSGKTTTLKPEIEFLPDRIGKPEITTLPGRPGTVEEPEIITLPGTVEEPEIIPMPYRPGTAELMPLPYKPGTAEITTLPYRPGQDNGYTNYPYYFNEEKTKGKTPVEDFLRGTGVKNTNEPSVKTLSNTDIQPMKYSMSAQNEGFTPRDENTIWNTINQLTYGDIDSVLAQEAERFGLPYSPDMNDIQKEKLGTIVYQYLYYELNVAKGADVTSPDQDKDILQKLYEIEYNEGKDARPISLAISAIGNVLFPQNREKVEDDSKRIGYGKEINSNCINGQGIEDNGIRKLKVGTKGTIAENGCGIIAIYNALTLNGIEIDFEDVLNEANNMDGLLLSGGKRGTNPNKIGNVLENHGLNYAKYNNPKDFNDAIKHGGTYIVSFWNDRNPWEGAHIVAFTSDKDGNIIVYNKTNTDSTPFKYRAEDGKTGLDKYLQGQGNSMTLYRVG